MRPLNARHERFCRTFVEYGCASGAARSAGYARQSARRTGYRLLRDPRIIARITLIEEEKGRLHCRADEVLLGKLETIYRRALADGKLHTAARAIDLQVKLRARAAAAGAAGTTASTG